MDDLQLLRYKPGIIPLLAGLIYIIKSLLKKSSNDRMRQN